MLLQNPRNQSKAATVGGKTMVSVWTLLNLSSLLLLTSSVDARRDPADYWKDVMKDQPMPEVIRGLIYSKPGSFSPLQENQKQEVYKSSDSYIQISAILYNGLDEHKEDKIPRKDSELNHSDSSLDIRQEEKKSFVETFQPKPNISVHSEGIESK